MQTLYITDGDADKIIAGVGLTVDELTSPDGDYSMFGDIAKGFKRKVDVDLSSLAGLMSGGGAIGYFSEAALKMPRSGAAVPLLTELIAAGARHDVVIPPLFVNSAESIAGLEPPVQMTVDEQHALFVRILGKDWQKKVEKLVASRKESTAA